MKNQKSEEIFKEYKIRTEQLVSTYNNLRSLRPLGAFPTTAAAIWRAGTLAEIWGRIATQLNKNKVNFLEDWRQGL